jgi:hypothetical protein
MAKTVQDPDFPCDAPSLIQAVLPPIKSRDPYFVIVGRDGSIWRLNRSRIAKIMSDGDGRITEIVLAP